MTIGGLTIAAIDAEAAPSPGCVTKTEFRKVHRGDTLERVARIFDTAGLRMSIAAFGGHKSQIRDYRTCKPDSAVHVSFDKEPGGRLRLSDKWAVWVV